MQALELASNALDLDLATRARKPAWQFPAVGHFALDPVPVPQQDLQPGLAQGLTRPRLRGVPDFALFLDTHR